MPITNYRSAKTQYRQGEMAIAKFTASGGAASTFTRVSGSNQVSNNKISVGALSSSTFTLTGPKVRLATLICAYVISNSAVAANQRTLYPTSEYNAATGQQTFVMVDNAGALATPAAGAILVFSFQFAG